MTTYDKIKDFISNYNETFTIKKVANELAISYHVTSNHLVKLASEGEILQVDIKNHIKVFISKSKINTMNFQGFISYYHIMNDFLKNYDDFFTAQKLENMLGLSYQVVAKNLLILVSEGEIIHIDFDRGKKVYISKAKANTLNYQGNYPILKTNYQKIKDFVENTTEPFSTIKLGIELNISPPVVRKWLSKLLNERHIKMIGFNKSTLNFISTKYQDNYCSDNISAISSFEKIMTYINNSNEPFTALQLAKELHLTYHIIIINIPKMLIKGYIKLIGRVNNKHIYISNRYHGIVPILTSLGKIKNYIHYSNKPFTVKQISNETELPLWRIRYYMKRLLNDGFIKRIGEDYNTIIYIRNKY
jgi:DNA-binding Lrp family transcriptional regulator